MMCDLLMLPAARANVIKSGLMLPTKEKKSVYMLGITKGEVEVKSSFSDLGENLEKIYATVMEWDADFGGELSKHRK